MGFLDDSKVVVRSFDSSKKVVGSSDGYKVPVGFLMVIRSQCMIYLFAKSPR